MERGVVALFGETKMATSDLLKAFVNQYNIPFYTWSYPRNDEMSLQNVESGESSK